MSLADYDPFIWGKGNLSQYSDAELENVIKKIGGHIQAIKEDPDGQLLDKTRHFHEDIRKISFFMDWRKRANSIPPPSDQLRQP